MTLTRQQSCILDLLKDGKVHTDAEIWHAMYGNKRDGQGVGGDMIKQQMCRIRKVTPYTILRIWWTGYQITNPEAEIPQTHDF